MKTILLLQILSIPVCCYISTFLRDRRWRKDLTLRLATCDTGELMPDGKTMYGNKPLRDIRP